MEIPPPKIKIPSIKILFKKNSYMPPSRRLNKKRLAIVAGALIALIVVIILINKINFTALIVKEEKPPCVDECDFEGNICENAKIFECSVGEDSCKHRILVEDCPEESKCSTIKEGECYTPENCGGDFHICISDVFYKTCKNGKTIEGADMKKCPAGLMCNRDPKQFAICVEKDY